MQRTQSEVIRQNAGRACKFIAQQRKVYMLWLASWSVMLPIYIVMLLMGSALLILLHTGKQTKVYSFTNTTLSTLAAATAVKQSLKVDASRLQGERIKDIFGKFTWEGKTVGDGPVYYGFCVDSLSVTEIAEIFNADPQSQVDTPDTERSMRRLIVVGEMPIAQAAAINEDDHWHKIMWPTSWKIQEGEGLCVFAFNRESSALASGTILHFDGMINGEWMED